MKFQINGETIVQRENPIKTIKINSHRYSEECGYINNEKFRGESHGNKKFNQILSKIFNNPKKILDLGCGGGKFVKDCIDDGDFALGFEGFEQYKNNKIHEWKNIPDNLHVINIAKKFEILDENKNKILFDVITAWEVLEHLFFDEIDNFLENVYNHTHENSLIVFTISFRPDNGHFTIMPYEWWHNKFVKNGFKINSDFEITPDCLVRNYSDSYLAILKKI